MAIFISLLGISFLWVESELLINLCHMVHTDIVPSSTEVFRPENIEKIPCSDLPEAFRKLTGDFVSEAIPQGGNKVVKYGRASPSTIDRSSLNWGESYALSLFQQLEVCVKSTGTMVDLKNAK